MGFLDSLYFLLWRPDMGEHRYDAKKQEGYSAGDAAEKLTDENFSNWSYPPEVEFHVQECDEEGKPHGPVMELTVYMEPRPSFSASKPKPVTAKPKCAR